jgi:hypothetical protein
VRYRTGRRGKRVSRTFCRTVLPVCFRDENEAEWGAWHVTHVIVPSGSRGRERPFIVPGAMSTGWEMPGSWHPEQSDTMSWRKFMAW